MTGIQFITDEKGRKTAAVIDLKETQGALGGHRGVLVPGRGGMKNAIPLDKVEVRPIKSAKLHG